jgi:hypothetical protein
MRERLVAVLEGQPGLCVKCLAQRLQAPMRDVLSAIREAQEAGVGLHVIFDDRCPGCRAPWAFVTLRRAAS